MHALSLHRAVRLAGIAIACAGCTRHAPPRFVEYPAPAAPVNDAMIEPGARIGRVALGMSRAQLVATVGQPYNATTIRQGAELANYPDLGLQVFLFFGHVYRIGIQTLFNDGQSYSSLRVIDAISPSHVTTVLHPGPGGYRTKDGIGLGTTVEELRSKMGEPIWTVLDGRVETDCYPQDTRIEVYRGNGPTRDRVVFIAIGACDDSPPQ